MKLNVYLKTDYGTLNIFMLEYKFIALHHHSGHKIFLHNNIILYEKAKDKSLYKRDYLAEKYNGIATNLVTTCNLEFFITFYCCYKH